MELIQRQNAAAIHIFTAHAPRTQDTTGESTNCFKPNASAVKVRGYTPLPFLEINREPPVNPKIAPTDALTIQSPTVMSVS